MSASSPEHADPLAPAAQEPCPTPLNWKEVIGAVNEDSQLITIPLDGGELTVDVYGRGPAIYFLGGATGSNRLFALTAYLLRDEYTCVLLNPARWKHRPRQPFEQVSQGIVRLANSLGHTTLNLYAAGSGCHQALSLTKHSPDRIGHLMLQSPALRQPTLLREKFLLWMGQYLSRPVASLPSWLKIQVLNHERYFPPFDTTRFQFLLDDVGITPIQQATYRWLAEVEADWRDLAPVIRCPILVIRCEGEGAVLAKLAEEFTAHVPGCSVEWLHTTGHYPYLTHPHRLVKLIKQFLNPPA